MDPKLYLMTVIIFTTFSHLAQSEPAKYLIHPDLLKDFDPNENIRDKRTDSSDEKIILKRVRRGDPTSEDAKIVERLENILKAVEERLFQLHENINQHGRHETRCDFSIPMDPKKDRAELNITTEKWLKGLHEGHFRLAHGLFDKAHLSQEVYNLLTSLDNSIEFAKEVKGKGKEITLCDQSLYLACSVNEMCECYTNNHPSKFDQSHMHWDGTMLNTSWVDKVKVVKGTDPGGTPTTIEDGLCMIDEGGDCPVGPSLIMCQPGFTCLTTLDKKPCTLKNLGFSFGLMLKQNHSYSLELESFSSYSNATSTTMKPILKARIRKRNRSPRSAEDNNNLTLASSAGSEDKPAGQEAIGSGINQDNKVPEVIVSLSDFTEMCSCFPHGFCEEFFGKIPEDEDIDHPCRLDKKPEKSSDGYRIGNGIDNKVFILILLFIIVNYQNL